MQSEFIADPQELNSNPPTQLERNKVCVPHARPMQILSFTCYR